MQLLLHSLLILVLKNCRSFKILKLRLKFIFTGLTHFNVKKVNLCLCTLWRQMVELGVQCFLFLTLPLDGGEWSPHGLTFTAQERAPSTSWIGGWVDPPFTEKIKVSFPFCEPNPGSSSHSLDQCFSTFVRPWLCRSCFHKTRARSQQIYL